jgi:hypothetical protein
VIYDLGGSGIRFKHSEGCTAFSNLIYDVGFEDGLGGGITFYCAPDTEISYNTVAMIDVPEPAAIFLYDGTGPQDCIVSARSKVHHNIGVRLGEGQTVDSDAFYVQQNNVDAPGLEIHDNVWWAAGQWRTGASAHGCPALPVGEPASVRWGGQYEWQGSAFIGCYMTVPVFQEATDQGNRDQGVDPGFVSTAARDFQLQPGSPAAGLGTAGDRERALLNLLGMPAAGPLDLGFQYLP